MNPGESDEIFSRNKGLRGLPPRIELHREGTRGSQDQLRIPADDWKPLATVRLINEAEVQYRFDHGFYADYATLLKSGQLERTGGFNSTIVPINLESKSEPLPGYIIHVSIAPESYTVSIRSKNPANCTFELFSNETGVVEKQELGCSAE
jgi:hypothetical protein